MGSRMSLSKLIINWWWMLFKGHLGCSSLNLIKHIFLLFLHFEKVQFHHIFREANECADYLAKLGMSSSIDFF